MPPAADPPEAASNLVIRATRVADFEALAILFSLPGFRAGTLRLPHPRPEQIRRWLENQSADTFSIVALRDSEIVGQAAFERFSGRRAHAAYLGIGVHDDHVGGGIGSALLREMIDAADQWFAIRRLELTVYIDNAPAIRLYEKFGFEREGLLRSFAFKAGHYVDAIAMARLRH